MSQVLTTASTDRSTDQDQVPAIELRGLGKTFGRGRHAVTAVEALSLTVPPGQVFGLLGPNGAGKTTTIKMMAGLLIPSAGTAVLNGFDVRRQRGSAVEQIGAVLEGSRNTYWSLTAMQNLLYFGRLKGLHGAEVKPRSERLLKDLGLWDRRDSRVGGFSRGMQQKVAIAAALVTDPPILLLDEPTIGLDVDAARTVRQWVTRLAHEEGKAIVLTTHQLAMADELCDRVAVIRNGRVITDLPIGELLDGYTEKQLEVRVPTVTLPDGCLGKDTRVRTVEDQMSITLPTQDQGALLALLSTLRDHGVPVLSVNPVRPSLEDIFVRLVRED